MKTTIYILHRTGEVYQKFMDSETAMHWLSLAGYLNQRVVIVQKGNQAHVWERIDDLKQLQKEINSFLFPSIKY